MLTNDEYAEMAQAAVNAVEAMGRSDLVMLVCGALNSASPNGHAVRQLGRYQLLVAECRQVRIYLRKTN